MSFIVPLVHHDQIKLVALDIRPSKVMSFIAFVCDGEEESDLSPKELPMVGHSPINLNRLVNSIYIQASQPIRV